MNYQIEKIESFQVVGLSKIFYISTSYQEIPILGKKLPENMLKK